VKVFENRVLRRICVPKKKWLEELHNVYASYIIRVIKSVRIGWAGHVARIGAMRNAYNIFI
jgi:hypothetical protein